MAEENHSYYSASAFEAAMLCPGKPVMERGLPNNANIYSATGTAAHRLLEFGLKDNRDPGAFLGRVFPVEGFDIEVDEDMVTAVNIALRNIRDFAGDGMLLAEQKVNYARYLGVERDQAWGTADVVIIRGDELQVHDYKNGSGVAVQAEGNPQLMLYGLGALDASQEALGPFTTVRLVIHQPNVREAPSEWTISVEDLEAWALVDGKEAVSVRQRAAQVHNSEHSVWADAYLNPGEKQCKFCRAKATCPKLRAEVFDVIGVNAATPDEFAEAEITSPQQVISNAADVEGTSAWSAANEWLSVVMSKAGLIEDWVKAVRAAVESELLAGKAVPGWKLVEGKRGNRKWADTEAAEAMLKTFRLKIEEMYSLKVISPTAAEKLAPKFKDGKPVPPKKGAPAPLIGARQWPKLQELITQSEGKPHVAPESDSRPALTLAPVADDLTNASVEDFA